MRQFKCLQCGCIFISIKACKSRTPKYCCKKCYNISLVGKPNKSNTKFKKGQIPHNKGKNMPIEFGMKISNCLGRSEKISQALKGKPLSDAHKKALSDAKKGKPIKHLIDNWEIVCKKISMSQHGIPRPQQRGENHGNWEGGKTSKNAKIRSSFEMIQWRRKVFERDDYTCQVCGCRGGKFVGDHIKPFCNYPDLRFDIDNGRTICKECDLKSDTYGGRAKWK